MDACLQPHFRQRAKVKARASVLHLEDICIITDAEHQ